MTLLDTPRVRVQSRWTYHDLDDLPDDLICYELWNGELIMSPAPTTAHQELVGRLHIAFYLFDATKVKGRVLLAPTDVVLREDLTLQPDLLWVAKAREAIIQPKRVMGAPDLCVEVLSPKTADADRNEKLVFYTAGGVREYWLVDPDARTLTIHALGEHTHTVYSAGAVARTRLPELDGLAVTVDDLFANL